MPLKPCIYWKYTKIYSRFKVAYYSYIFFHFYSIIYIRVYVFLYMVYEDTNVYCVCEIFYDRKLKNYTYRKMIANIMKV